MVPEQERNQRGRNKLTERGGMGLVMFHLARLGYDFVATHGDSAGGDLWVQTKTGKIGIEVKTTLKEAAWHVRRAQIEAKHAELYCLVRLSGADCFLVPAARMVQLVEAAPDIYPGVARLTEAVIPPKARNAWNLLGFKSFGEVRVIRSLPRKGDGRKAARRVKHVLASGEVKIYEYPAYAP